MIDAISASRISEEIILMKQRSKISNHFLNEVEMVILDSAILGFRKCGYTFSLESKESITRELEEKGFKIVVVDKQQNIPEHFLISW